MSTSRITPCARVSLLGSYACSDSRSHSELAGCRFVAVPALTFDALSGSATDGYVVLACVCVALDTRSIQTGSTSAGPKSGQPGGRPSICTLRFGFEGASSCLCGAMLERRPILLAPGRSVGSGSSSFPPPSRVGHPFLAEPPLVPSGLRRRVAPTMAGTSASECECECECGAIQGWHLLHRFQIDWRQRKTRRFRSFVLSVNNKVCVVWLLPSGR